ncbi:MAG: beta-lactamase family protein [Gammaproteobacteria bacterium]|nr:beta-lactamase family protein [Gammaproteobacteria bacterium]
MRLVPLALIAATSFAPGAFAAPVTAVLPGFDAQVEEVFALTKVPALALVVVAGGKPVYTKTLGVRSRAKPEPIDEHTLFRIASVSKTFAGVLAGQQLNEGRLRLSDPVSKYIPGFRLKYDRAGQLNLEHVLSHTAGLPHHAYDDLLEAGQPYGVLLQRVQTLGAACRIGTCFSYQNILYSTIGNAMEKATGQNYEQLIQNRLFTPLGMRDSGVTLKHFYASTNAALPHIRSARGYWPKPVDQPYFETQPASGVSTSIHDLGQYLAAAMGHRPDVIAPAVMKELTRPRIATPKEGLSSKWRRTRVKNPKYGLGWRVFQYDGRHPMIFHAGGQFGVSSVIGYLPGKDVGMAMLWNASEGRVTTLMPQLFDAVLDLPAVDYLEKPKPTAKKAKKKSRAQLLREQRKARAKGASAKTKKAAAKKKAGAKKPATKKKAAKTGKRQTQRKRTTP